MRLERITVSEDGHHLVTEGGRPFFWLGDTAWELFHRLTLPEARIYFAARARQRFNVIQAVALAECDGLHAPDPYGEIPLLNDDPAQPNERYFQRLKAYVGLAAEYGLYIGLLPTWGDKVIPLWGKGPAVFNAGNARVYGEYLGRLCRDLTNVLWILGGDRPAEHEGHDCRPVWRALAAGLDAGAGRRVFKTYHPMGGRSTSEALQSEDWLDMHMQQSGHGGGHDVPVWEWIARDYALTPRRPVLDAEPNYEDHPVCPWPRWNPRNGFFRDGDVRRQLYRSVLAGGCGVTYGHHFVWQFWSPGRTPVNNGDAFIPWFDALHRPGAEQVRHLRALIESRPMLARAPAPDLVLGAGVGWDPARRDTRPVAACAADGRYAFIYLPRPSPVTLDLNRLAGNRFRVWWFCPTDGTVEAVGEFPRTDELTLTPDGRAPDRVLVLDDASAGLGPPGVGESRS